MISPFLPASPAAPAGYDIVPSPVGRILLTGDDAALSGLYLLDAGEDSATIRSGWVHRPGGFAATADQLAEYFAGTRTEFELPLAPRGAPFQLAVWAELLRIPFGRTCSYGAVALALGKSQVASRAVGLANGANPISIIAGVPPGNRRRRLAHRLRLGRGLQRVAAAARGRRRGGQLAAHAVRLAAAKAPSAGAAQAAAGPQAPGAGCRPRPGRTRRP